MSVEELLSKISGDVGYVRGKIDAIEQQTLEIPKMRERLATVETRVREHIGNDDIHSTPREIQTEVEEELVKRGLMDKTASAVQRHPKATLASVILTSALLVIKLLLETYGG